MAQADTLGVQAVRTQCKRAVPWAVPGWLRRCAPSCRSGAPPCTGSTTTSSWALAAAAATWPTGLARTHPAACSSSRQGGRTARPSCTCPSPTSRPSAPPPTTGCSGPTGPPPDSRAAAWPGPGGRSSGAPRPSTACCTCAVSRTTTTRGRPPGMRAGFGVTCCRTSGRARTHPSRARSEGRAGRCPSVRQRTSQTSRSAGRRPARRSAACPGSKGAGVAYFSNIKSPDGFRCSTALPLHEVRGQRPNLHILCGTEVQEIVLQGSRVEGLHFKGQQGQEVRVAPGGEVVLSAGALGSPHILLRSGIGEPAALERAGVACRHALPGVGENLQDHLQLRPKFRVNCGTMNTQVCTFVDSRPGLPAPDLQFHFQPLSTTGTPAVYLDAFDAFTASVCILRPHSRGRVELQPDGSLRISPHYLTAEQDQELAVRSLEIAREVSRHPLLQELGAEEVDPPARTDLDHAHRVAETIYHPAGTCKMGPAGDIGAVVDPALRVHGLEGLRVVDCSVMPTITSGNTHAPTVMIAEKAASLLRGRS
uniref:Glucose-methanol-choline oxidoreductase N-terminal domain-containing protein n=1 Tax=Alexandrium monilatum TaxID=311494 RepID=A0A7S4VCC1_9DINO